MNDDKILNEIKIMRGKVFKRLGKTHYKYVYIVSYDGIETYRAELNKYHLCKCFSDSRMAALAVDKRLLEAGLNPVNILKKK
jgi:hypothetical protein